jgi:hypothetical protein
MFPADCCLEDWIPYSRFTCQKWNFSVDGGNVVFKMCFMSIFASANSASLQPLNKLTSHVLSDQTQQLFLVVHTSLNILNVRLKE